MIKKHHKRYSSNVITQILADKIINNLTINASCATKRIDTAILNLCTEGNRKPLCVCDQYEITFETRKKMIGLCNTSYLDSRDK